ncbi:MAG: hypothetical protein U0174_21395 [Polyangiaceae bacterium]
MAEARLRRTPREQRVSMVHNLSARWEDDALLTDTPSTVRGKRFITSRDLLVLELARRCDTLDGPQAFEKSRQ